MSVNIGKFGFSSRFPRHYNKVIVILTFSELFLDGLPNATFYPVPRNSTADLPSDGKAEPGFR